MIRKAHIAEAQTLVDLVRRHAETDQMLFRTLAEVQSHIQDFLVYEKDGRVVGTCSLSLDMGGMVEIRSLAVHPDFYRQGIATDLIEESIRQASLTEYRKIFVLTYAMPLFEKLGFKVIDKNELPQKIWKDCQGCRKQNDCDETAMIRDVLPVSEQATPGTVLTTSDPAVPA